MAHWTPEKTLAARREYEKAAAKAWAGLAHVLMIDYLRGWNKATPENVVLAERALQKAYAIDQSVALAHIAKAKIREVKGDLEGEIDALNEALGLEPNLTDAYAHKANALILLGRAQEALEVLKRAPEPARGDPELGLFYWFMGRAYFNLPDYPKAIAIDWLQKSVGERPTTWVSWAHLISAYALTNQLHQPEAQKALNTYEKNFMPDWRLDNIKKYYDQPKYHNAPPQLHAALGQYYRGLEDSHQAYRVP